MKPELIIVIVVALIGLYIFIQLNITNSKIKSKAPSKPAEKAKKEEKVELKTVIAPKPDPVKLEADYLKSEEEIMRKAALESIEDERRWKESIEKAEELKLDTKTKAQQSEIDLKLKEMQAKLNQLDMTIEEQNFIDEVNNLSPQLKAILFADFLKRKSDF